MKTPREDLQEWRYLSRGHVRHLMYGAGLTVAYCGAEAFPSWNWFGTGTQEEYEKAAHLPKCKRCLRLAGEL